MLNLKTKKELSIEAHKLAKGQELVRYRSTTYMPAHFETGDISVIPPRNETMWLPMTRENIRQLAADQFDTLFASDGELSGFDFMVSQNSEQASPFISTLLVRTEEGLRELRADGKLHNPTGDFVPNTLIPTLNTEQSTKQRVFDTIAGWLNSDEEARALLKHLATALAPGWSAVKYVLLLGEGRNGKSLLLRMLAEIFGHHNVSNVTRQAISEQSPVVLDLNGKLLNIVYDGKAEYVKDSGLEKSLVAGEPVSIRRLYESVPTVVQTNALFIEGLNKEPKSTDKSLALQKRLMRFQFPNVYAVDRKFERFMLHEDSLGALLSLLLDHYVLEEELASELAPTAAAMELQLEHMVTNSLGLQFLKYIEETDAVGVDVVIGWSMSELAQRFSSWRVKENDISTWSEPDIVGLFQPILNTERKSIRIDGAVRKIRMVESLKSEAAAFIQTLKGEEDDVEALVAD